jgi:hypothetical protein
MIPSRTANKVAVIAAALCVGISGGCHRIVVGQVHEAMVMGSMEHPTLGYTNLFHTTPSGEDGSPPIHVLRDQIKRSFLKLPHP